MEPTIYTTDTNNSGGSSNNNENGTANLNTSGTTQVSFEVNCYQDTPKNQTPNLNSLKLPTTSAYTSPPKRGTFPSLSPLMVNENSTPGGAASGFGHHRRTNSSNNSNSNTTGSADSGVSPFNKNLKPLNINNTHKPRATTTPTVTSTTSTNNNTDIIDKFKKMTSNDQQHDNAQVEQQEEEEDRVQDNSVSSNENSGSGGSPNTITTPPLSSTSTSTSISQNEKDIEEVDEFVIISEIHDTGLIMYDNHGFLVDQDQIQNHLIYKDKFVKEDQMRRDNWMSYLEKNPGALHNLVAKHPHTDNSNNSNNNSTPSPSSLASSSSSLSSSSFQSLSSSTSSSPSPSTPNNSNNNNNIQTPQPTKSYRQKIPKPFKELIRSGIPGEYRSMVWFRASGGYARLSENQDEYFNILKENEGKKSIATKQILMDVDRTFPDHKFLNTKEKMESLTNVLVAYSWRNPKVGYCQCMNFIAGFLLIYMSEPEAYWTLVSIIEELLPTEYFTNTMIDSSVDVRFVFDDLLQKKIPKLHHHLTSQNLTLPLIITQWFLCLMATTTPTETTFRIWDVFFSEGSKVLFRVALSFFKLSEEKILSCRDYGTLYNLIKKVPSVMYDADLLLDVSFKRLGSFPMKLISQKRKDSKHIITNEYLEFQKLRNKN